MKRHTTEQNMTTVEDGHNTADDGETHNENRREIQTQQHSKLINLLEAEHIILQIRESSGHKELHSRSFHETRLRTAYNSTCEEMETTLSGYGWWYERGYC